MAINSTSDVLRANRAFLGSIRDLATHAEATFLDRVDISVTTHSAAVGDQEETQHWAVCNSFSAGAPRRMAMDTQNEYLKLLPWCVFLVPSSKKKLRNNSVMTP